MKTTVEISDALFREAQKLAARERTTLKALINEGLHKVVETRSARKSFKLKDASVKGKGLHPELREAGWEAIRAIIYEGRGG